MGVVVVVVVVLVIGVVVVAGVRAGAAAGDAERAAAAAAAAAAFRCLGAILGWLVRFGGGLLVWLLEGRQLGGGWFGWV